MLNLIRNQIEELGISMRNRLRRRDQKSGGSSEKFMEMIKRLVQINKLPPGPVKERRIRELRDEDCLDLNKDESTQDQRVQIARYTRDGNRWKEKKVYMELKIYILFNIFDPERPNVSLFENTSRF